MSSVLPYLGIRDDDAGCDREVLNNCRTLAYMARSIPHATIESGRLYPDGWEADDSGCGECCCPTFDDGNYTYPSNCNGNPAPWFNSSNPATGEAFGMLVEDIEVESADSARVVAEQSAPLITITGRILASSRRGIAAYKRWLKNELVDCCSACGGLHLSLYEHCSPLAAVCAPMADAYSPPLDIAGEEPEAVESPDPAPWNDDGNRAMVRARYKSIDDLTDDEPIPGCVSAKVVIQLELRAPEQFARPIFCCTIDTWMGCEPGPEPLDIDDVTPGCEQCGVPCRCSTEPEVFDEDDSLPDFAGIPTEPSNDIPLVPKPLIEPEPVDCPATVLCAQNNGMVINLLTGFIDLAASGVPTTGVFSWVPGGSSPDWLYRMVSYFECMGVTFSSEDSGDQDTLAGFLANCSSVAGANQVTVQMNYNAGGGDTGIRFAPSATAGGFGSADCNFILANPPAMQTNLWEGDPYSTADLDCINGCTAVSPTLDGEEFPEGFLYAFPLIYNGTVVADGDAFAAILTAERACGTIVWHDEFHPTTPCTYCLPNSCARQVVANLETPPDRVAPLVNGVQGACPIPWPMIYKGRSIADGDAFAAALSDERGCNVTWDDTDCVYILEKGCDRTVVAALTSTATVEPDEECYQTPDEVRRGACYIPAMPDGLVTALEIQFCNTTQAIENATVAVYAAQAGAPHILNQPVGAPRYHASKPLFEGQISGLAPYSTLTLDGRDGTLNLHCIDGTDQAANGVIQAPGRKPARVPTLGCGPHWVEVRLDCDNAGDLDQEVHIRLHPVMDPV